MAHETLVHVTFEHSCHRYLHICLHRDTKLVFDDEEIGVQRI
jgi:hypothetical protein